MYRARGSNRHALGDPGLLVRVHAVGTTNAGYSSDVSTTWKDRPQLLVGHRLFAAVGDALRGPDAGRYGEAASPFERPRGAPAEVTLFGHEDTKPRSHEEEKLFIGVHCWYVPSAVVTPKIHPSSAMIIAKSFVGSLLGTSNSPDSLPVVSRRAN